MQLRLQEDCIAGSHAIVCNADVKLMQGINQVVAELDAPVIWKLTQHDQNVFSQQNGTFAKQAHLVTFATTE